jgi:hypothetical protein
MMYFLLCTTGIDYIILEFRFFFILTEQNRIFIGVKSIYKGLLPKQHTKLNSVSKVYYSLVLDLFKLQICHEKTLLTNYLKPS